MELKDSTYFFGETMKGLILTGCAGFIGLNLLKAIVKDTEFYNSYDYIISIDKMGYATKFNKKEYNSLCDIYSIFQVNADITTLNINNSYTKPSEEMKYDIIDLASESHVDNSIANPFGIYKENALIPASLVEWVGIKNINKYVHITTDEIYGELPLTTPEENWFNEASNFHPNNPYSAGKAAQDCFLISLKHTFGLNLRFIRLANEFGPYQHSEKMLPATILRALTNQPIKIYGNGENKRQWTPVVDSVKIIIDVVKGKIDEELTHIAKKGDIPNNNEVVEMWRKILKDDFNINTHIEYVADRKGHDLMYALKTNSVIDSYFTESNLTRFRESIKFYIENKSSYLA